MLIRNSIRFVGRMIRQPSYFMNGFRFLQWWIEHALKRLWPAPDVCKPRAKSFRSLLIVLRSSDTVQHCSPSSRGLEEYGINDKHDVVMKCGVSFVEAVRVFRERRGDVKLRIVLVEDRLSDEGKALYRRAGSVEELTAPSGNRETFEKQVDVALQADDDTLVCFLEDDYLLRSEVFCEVFDLFNSTSIDGFTPHFHPGLVNGDTKVGIFSVSGKFYAQVITTTCTFFIPAVAVRRNLTRLRRYYGSEIGNINEIWRNHVCFAPCCRTLAEHMHRSDLSYVWKGMDV